jgi:type I restriction enzyme S subunit
MQPATLRRVTPASAADDLPEGWERATLADVTLQISDGSHNPPPRSEGGVPMLSARNVLDGQILFSDYRRISEADYARELRRVKIAAGDVLLTIVGTIGRSAVVHANHLPFAAQRSIAVLKPNRVDAQYMSFFLRSQLCQDYLSREARGVAQGGVYLNQVEIVEIPISPTKEQRRIVAKVEELLAQVNQVRERLARVPTILKRFRQSVLSAACSGGERTALGAVLLDLKYGTAQKCDVEPCGVPATVELTAAT